MKAYIQSGKILHKKRNIGLQSLLDNWFNKRYSVKTVVNDDRNMMKKVVSWLFMIALVCMILSGCVEERTVEEKTSQFDPSGNLVVIEGKGEYNFIQDAIDAASDGDTIVVYNGTYNETVVLDKSINLFGETTATPLLMYDKGIEDDMGIIRITADNCTVKGFKIVNANSSLDAVGIKIFSSYNIISNNTILNTSYGVYVYRDSQNNVITWNNISNSSCGIYLLHVSHNNISRNNIVDNYYGIHLDHAYTSTISWNNISGGLYGIRLKGTTGNQIFGNILFDNIYGMFFCCGAKGNTMFYNTFKQSNEENANDTLNNQWDNGVAGNYWDDYTEKYPAAIQLGDVWDTPYIISDGENQDRFPLVNPVQT